jgi:hypothetical protein
MTIQIREKAEVKGFSCGTVPVRIVLPKAPPWKAFTLNDAIKAERGICFSRAP